MPSFLVTGAAGFIGYALAKKLAQDPGNHVTAVDNFVRGEPDDSYLSLCSQTNVTRLDVDLTRQDSVSKDLPDNIDYVFHMAALNGTQNFYERPFEVVRCCTLPTMFLLEKYGPLGTAKRFIYAGTSEAYASTVTKFGWPVPTDENVPLSIDDVNNERWSYGGSKMQGEIATLMGGRNFGMDVSIIRYHNAYGPRMGDKHVIPDFLVRARSGVMSLYGYENTRSFIYIDDVVDATLLIGLSENCANEIVNVGGTDEVTMLALAEEIMQIADLKGEIDLYPAPNGSVLRRAPDISKLQRLTGYNPKFSLTDGLRETIKFYLS